MRALLALVVLGLSTALAGCSGCSDTALQPDADDNSGKTFDQCGGDPPSFVRQAFLALDGRRPRSQAEVDVYVDLYTAAEALGDDPKEAVARAIMNRPEFADRWVDVAMDALHVQRVDIQNEASCWDEATRSTVTPALAQTVRDQPATQTGDGTTWTMLDLARSALALDDLTPIYRAQLFSMVSHPIPAANVPPIEAELARRADFGATFDASYLHRDVVCLGCHTSDSSVTDREDPAIDRHWPVPGAPELAVYGNAQGIESERAHAVFRVDNFVEAGNVRPWGWSSRCGRFAAPGNVDDDLANIDGKLASTSGKRATVYALEQALARGFAALKTGGVPAEGATLTDPDTALAWLVTLKVTEDVWKQATGTSLTIANYFPRNQASSQLLYQLASRFAASGYSLKALLAAIVATDYFNRQPAEAGCGPSPYTYPNVFDPWVIADADEARRKNGPGDAVTAVDARTLIGATAAALEWSAAPGGQRFPDFGEGCDETATCSGLNANCNNFNACCTTYQIVCQQNGVFPATEVPFQRSVGTFLRNSERGFRGLDFQARLAWEDRYGSCTRPGYVATDFIDRLATAGAADGTATAADLIAALKDRLVGEPAIAAGGEADALAAIVGALDQPASAVPAAKLREVCGALLVSPQYLLQGIAGRGGPRPKLTPATATYEAVCGELATAGIGVAGRVVTCGTTLTLAAGRSVAAPPPVHVPVDTVPRERGRPPGMRTPAPTRRM